jgi:Tol biopolymer transport system component
MMRCEICIYDLAKDEISVLLDHDGHIEAPNWHPDGYLIVNGGGLIYRVDLTTPELVQIDTGFATACNNDHGISPDAKTLVISARADDGQSCIYTLPVTGGRPERVTQNTPSYWHGWSPDGTTLAYVGKRTGPFALYTCPTQGGEETLVTDDFDHCDGPDYTPDGAYIWFNGERDSAVNLWRIRPDGSDLEQMTDDDTVNWFPHPSPDGQHILYLAYPPGTQGHPANLNVTLRLMPATGGAPRDLIALTGGQGTINVPCWAPDSDHFAFIRFVI